jgi:hypothetical protein
MQARYSCSRIRVPVIAVCLLALPISMRLEKTASAESAKPDPRVIRLAKFFSGLHCPVVTLSEDFVRAADNNRLDWRLLPSISLVESGGGKAYKNNNIFGWNNGEQPFASIRDGINEVAFKLGNSPLYRCHGSAGKLRLYNSNEGYVQTVLSVMNRISPVVQLRPA